jgi:hypothetical protein
VSQATNVTTPHEGKIVADALAGLIEEVKGQQERSPSFFASDGSSLWRE